MHNVISLVSISAIHLHELMICDEDMASIESIKTDVYREGEDR